MDVETYLVDRILDEVDYTPDHKKQIRDTYLKVRKLFLNAKQNHNIGSFFIPRDTLNYCRAFNIGTDAIISSAKADYQTHNIWVDVYNKTIRNAGLTEAEKSFMYCLRYMIYVESIYGEIVDKMCYLLVRQTGKLGVISGKGGRPWEKVGTVGAISPCSMQKKCEFLAKNGFNDLADAFDRDIRNATAHTDFIIGEPVMRNESYETETGYSVRSETRIERADIRVKRHVNGSVKWEKVDMNAAGHQLEMVVWLYRIVFSMCFQVHWFTSMSVFRDALEHPDDPRYKVTFSKGRIQFHYDHNP